MRRINTNNEKSRQYCILTSEKSTPVKKFGFNKIKYTIFQFWNNSFSKEEKPDQKIQMYTGCITESVFEVVLVSESKNQTD